MEGNALKAWWWTPSNQSPAACQCTSPHLFTHHIHTWRPEQIISAVANSLAFMDGPVDVSFSQVITPPTHSCSKSVTCGYAVAMPLGQRQDRLAVESSEGGNDAAACPSAQCSRLRD